MLSKERKISLKKMLENKFYYSAATHRNWNTAFLKRKEIEIMLEQFKYSLNVTKIISFCRIMVEKLPSKFDVYLAKVSIQSVTLKRLNYNKN